MKYKVQKYFILSIYKCAKNLHTFSLAFLVILIYILCLYVYT